MAEALTQSGTPMEPGRLRRAEISGRRSYDRSRRDQASTSAPLGGPGDVRRYFGGMLEAAGVPAERVVLALERFLDREREDGLWTRPMEGAREALNAVHAM